MKKKQFYTIGIMCLFLSSTVYSDYSNHPDGIRFAEHMFDKHKFSKSSTIALLKIAKRSESVIEAMQRPAEKIKPWHGETSCALPHRPPSGERIKTSEHKKG